MSRAPSPSEQRRDDRRLARLHRGARWICAAAGLGLLGTLPDPTAGMAGLGLLALLAPLGGRLRLPSLRRAPAVAPLALLLAWAGLIEPTTAVAAVLALLLVTESAANAAGASAHRIPLLTLLAALLACTTTTDTPLAPLLLVAGLAGTTTLLLETLCGDGEGAPRSAALASPRNVPLLAALLVGLIAASAIAFLALPRHPAREARVPVPTHRLIGYAEQVRLGELAEALADPTPIFRVRFDEASGSPPGPFHYRGVVLDSFDGTTWTAMGSVGDPPLSAPASDTMVRQSFRFEPTAPPILVGVPRVEAISVPLEDLELAASGTMLHRGGPRLHGYTAWSTPDSWRAQGEPTAQAPQPPPPLFLTLPPTLDPAVIALAREATAGLSDPATRAEALMTLLATDYRYEHRPSTPLGARPLEAFLLDHRQGHCELFATALAVLLRAVEIPSRVVNGFYGGEWNPVGRYWLIRHADAHAWVEAWLPGRGWVSLDPTPATQAGTSGLASAVIDHASSQWTHRVLGLDGRTQLAALSAPGAELRQLLGPTPTSPSLERPSRGLDLAISLAMVTAILTGFVLAWRQLAPWLAGERVTAEPASGEVERCLRAGRALLCRRGWEPPRHLPPEAAARWAILAAGPEAEPFALLASLHYRVRYGREDDASLAEQAREALRALRSMTPRGAAPVVAGDDLR